MDRRQYLSIIGTAGLGAGALFVGYQLQQGNLELGDSSVVSEEIHDGQERFTFEATAGDDIHITINDKGEEYSPASIALEKPDGNQVEEEQFVTVDDTTRRYTTAQTGSFSLTVGTEGRVQVSVSVVTPDE